MKNDLNLIVDYYDLFMLKGLVSDLINKRSNKTCYLTILDRQLSTSQDDIKHIQNIIRELCINASSAENLVADFNT